MAGKSNGALASIRVLDLSRVLSGAYTGMLLADFGADVIKIEVPGRGDDSRNFGPFTNGESHYYMNLNRNKRSVTLNLKGEGRQLFLEMVKQADVLIENYRPGVMKRLGLDYDVLKEVNPRLIYGAVSGFGQWGPYAERPGYDLIAQAMSGLMSVTGYEGQPPLRVGAPLIDVMGGLSLAVGILAALNQRKATGKGQMVDVSLFASALSGMQTLHPFYIVDNHLPSRIGNRYETNYPNDSYQTKDGYMVISAANDGLWQKLCGVIGREDLAFSKEYDVNPKRVARYEELRKIVQAWVQTHTTKEAVKKMLAAGVPAAPIHDFVQIMEDPHVEAHRLFVEVDHPKAGKTKLFNTHIRMSETENTIYRPSPTLGQHSGEVYAELLGLSEEQVSALRQSGTI